jgi:hypothetical protein
VYSTQWRWWCGAFQERLYRDVRVCHWKGKQSVYTASLSWTRHYICDVYTILYDIP